MEDPLKIYSLKRMTIPKVAVLAAGLAVALLAATIDPTPAQATPDRARDCTSCHGSGSVAGTVTAVPSLTTMAASAAYTVLITAPTSGGGDTGYWIANSDAAGVTGTSVKYGGATGTAAPTYTVPMAAPAAAGTYYYKVWAVNGLDDASGVANFALYSITVGAAPTTVPPTTVPPTTVPPTTVPPTTVPPTTVPPTTVPPVATGATITKISPDRASVGKKVTIRGTGFGTPGEVMFGTVSAKVLKWTSTKIVVKVPAKSVEMVTINSALKVPVWYRHSESVLVTVTPEGETASNGVLFNAKSAKGDHKDGDKGDHKGDRERHSLRDIPGHYGLFDGSDD